MVALTQCLHDRITLHYNIHLTGGKYNRSQSCQEHKHRHTTSDQWSTQPTVFATLAKRKSSEYKNKEPIHATL